MTKPTKRMFQLNQLNQLNVPQSKVPKQIRDSKEQTLNKPNQKSFKLNHVFSIINCYCLI